MILGSRREISRTSLVRIDLIEDICKALIRQQTIPRQSFLDIRISDIVGQFQSFLRQKCSHSPDLRPIHRYHILHNQTQNRQYADSEYRDGDHHLYKRECS
jgi:hypothetical protein